MGGFRGGGGDDDNAVDVSSSCSDIHVDPFAATFLMVHVHEVTYVLHRVAMLYTLPGETRFDDSVDGLCRILQRPKKQDRTSAS